MADRLKVILVEPPIDAVSKHKATIEALGLGRLNKTVELPNNETVRDMLWHVERLVKVEEI